MLSLNNKTRKLQDYHSTSVIKKTVIVNMCVSPLHVSSIYSVVGLSSPGVFFIGKWGLPLASYVASGRLFKNSEPQFIHL